MRKVTRTKYYSHTVGQMPKGCQLCVKGQKLVLYITGVCGSNCYYCPLSDTRKDKDFVWANEWKVEKKTDVLEEVKLSGAKGAGITGGNPLLKLDRTISHIQMLKSTYGKSFHIHLYAPISLVTKKRIEYLHRSGLDEIRMHPDLDFREDWRRIAVPARHKWSIGLELPVIPGKKKELMELIDYAKDKVHFINLNELEFSDNNACQLAEHGFKRSMSCSYVADGSDKLAKELLNHIARRTKLSGHYCTAKLKDGIQLKNRIKLRAKNIKKPYDRISCEGTLVRGVIYMKELVPDYDYRLRLQLVNRKSMTKKLFKVKRMVQSKLKVRNDMLDVDLDKMRLLSSEHIVKKNRNIIKMLRQVPAIVEEYPTHDSLEVEVEFL